MAKKRTQAVKKRQRRSGTASPELVTWALNGIQQAIDAARAKLEDLEAQARRLRGATRAAAAAAVESFTAEGQAAPAKPAKARKKRKLSADARNRIAEAQKRRWAKVRAKKATQTS